MAVSVQVDLGGALFVPVMQRPRGGRGYGFPVGTLAVNAEATGAAGGGVVSIQLQATRTMFGFRVLLVPTKVISQSELAAVEAVAFVWRQVGNRRLNMDLVQVAQEVASGDHFAEVDAIGILIEPTDDTLRDVCNVNWQTNTDTKVYHAHVLFAVYDLEILEKHGSLSSLVTGVR